MTQGTTALLGAVAGLTIFLGLPVARLGNLRKSVQGFLNALATGILIFLLWDVLSRPRTPSRGRWGRRTGGRCFPSRSWR